MRYDRGSQNQDLGWTASACSVIAWGIWWSICGLDQNFWRLGMARKTTLTKKKGRQEKRQGANGGAGTKAARQSEPVELLGRRIFFTIDDEGLYVIPYGSLLGEIARVPYPITFQCPDTNRLIGF